MDQTMRAGCAGPAIDRAISPCRGAEGYRRWWPGNEPQIAAEIGELFKRAVAIVSGGELVARCSG